MQTTNAGHNTHGSIELINGQWYVFYHRPPRGFGFARQAVVAPVNVKFDQKSVAQGGTVTITGYDPYTADNKWTAKDSKGLEYTGGEVTSEGFHIYGLDPYQYYSAGYASYLSDNRIQQDSWDIWDNHMPIEKAKNGNIIGYKYFGFGGLKRAQKGLKPFAGTRVGNNTKFNLWLTPKTDKTFKVNVWLDGPWNNATWKGKKIAEIIVPANSKQEATQFTVDVAKYVDNLDKKHAIYLVAEAADNNDALFDLMGLGFSSRTKKISRPVPPAVNIAVNGQALTLPAVPVRSTNANGITEYDLYETTYKLPEGTTVPTVTASTNNPAVKVYITQAASATGKAVVKFDYKGVVKTYNVAYAQ